jgi:nicotinamide mononucleotide transporter
VVSLLLAKGKIEGYFFALASAALYAFVAWRMNLYGEIAIQLFVMYPIAIFGIIAWSKNRRKDRIDGQVVIIGHVGTCEFLLVCASQVLMASGYYFLLEYLGTRYLIFSTASLILTILTGYLLLRRSRKSMIFNVLSDLPTLLIWIFMISGGDSSVFPLLVMESLYVVQDTVGIFEWRGLKKRQCRQRNPRRNTLQ